jgi:hypothetical protein
MLLLEQNKTELSPFSKLRVSPREKRGFFYIYIKTQSTNIFM